MLYPTYKLNNSGDALRTPTAPADMVSANGALTRRVYVVPSLDLVVTRIGDQPERGFDRQFWELLMAARVE